MDQLDNLIPLNELCQNPKCQKGDYCRKFHGEDDCITINVKRDHAVTKPNDIIITFRHKAVNNHHTIFFVKPIICPYKIKNMGYCLNGESCTKLHDNNDKIRMTFYYDKKPIIIHKYCYSIMPVLPIEIWNIIIEYNYKTTLIVDYGAWIGKLPNICKLSKSLSTAIKRFLLDHKKMLLKRPLAIFFDATPYIDKCLSKINLWENNNKIRSMIKDIDVLEPGYITKDNRCSTIFTPNKVVVGDSNNFFETDYANKKILKSLECRALNPSSIFKHTVDYKLGIHYLLYAMEMPAIIIPIIKENIKDAYLLCYYDAKFHHENEKWIITKYCFAKNNNYCTKSNTILAENVINIIDHAKNIANDIQDELDDLLKIASNNKECVIIDH